jgi:hypothetical protein
MPINNTTMNVFMISSHPYAFDAMFVLSGSKVMRWTGAGRVVLHASGGGVNKAWALIEADDEGYIGLKEAGFNVQRANKGLYVNSSGASSVVEDDGGLVLRGSGSAKELLA